MGMPAGRGDDIETKKEAAGGQASLVNANGFVGFVNPYSMPVARAVEAMRAEVALGQTDGLHHAVQGVELQRIHTDMLAQHLDEVGVFGRRRVAILLDVLVVVALHLLHATARDELQDVLRGREVEEGTAEEQGRTADAHVHLLGAVVVEHLHVVAQLRATHDAVVAEGHLLAFEQGTVGDELHLGHMLALALVDGHETPRPGGGVLHHAAQVRDLAHVGIAQGHADARVGDGRDIVEVDVVLLAHLAAFVVARLLHVDAFVVGGREAVVDPQEGAHLLLRSGSQQLLHTITRHLDDFAGTQAIARRIVEVDIGVALRGQHIAVVALAHHDGRAAVEVAGRDDAVLGEDEHRARALHLIIYVADAVDEVLALGDEEGHQLGGVGGALAQLREVLLAGEAVVDQLIHIVDLGHRGDGELAEVRVDDDGLRVGVADDADAVVTRELVDGHLIAELGAEIRVLDVVDGAVKHLAVVGDHTRAFGAEM